MPAPGMLDLHVVERHGTNPFVCALNSAPTGNDRLWGGGGLW